MPDATTTEALVKSGWNELSLGELISLRRGHDLTWRDRRPGRVPVVGSAGINGYHNEALASGPGVVLGRSGASFGQAHYINRAFWPHNTALYVTDFRGNHPRFVYYLLSSVDFSRHNSGGAQQSLNRNFIAPLKVWVPGHDEQVRVADVLDDATEHIELLERLIAKKQTLRQGMMQQLLTGKTRLPGFTAPWHEFTLGEVASIDPEALPAGTDPRTLLDYISLEDVERGELLGHTRVRFGSAPSRARRVIKETDVLFGTVRPNLQSHMIYRGGLERPIASTGFAVVRASAGRSDPQCIFYLLMSHLTTVQIDRIIAGSNYPAVSSSDVRGLTFSFPPPDEQRAIGSALADCDNELTALQRHLAKMRNVKHGMMQALLTGRSRLTVEEGAA